MGDRVLTVGDIAVYSLKAVGGVISAISGCGNENNGNEDVAPTCEMGTNKCEQNNVFICADTANGTEWVLEENCSLNGETCTADDPVCKAPPVCTLDSYECDEDHNLFRCDPTADGGTNWELLLRCGDSGQVCDSALQGCKPGTVTPPEETEVCETRTVEFDCENVGDTWQFSAERCIDGVYPIGAFEVPRSVSNLCGDDDYASPLLTPGEWIAVTFTDIDTELNRLLITYLGKHVSNWSNYDDADVQVDELNSRTITVPSVDTCDPAILVFENDELINPSTTFNVAYDGAIRITITGASAPIGEAEVYDHYTRIYLSKLIATFCHME